MSTKNPFSKTKYTCYFTYLAMSSVFSLPPILLVTFREMYGISYTLLGTLVLTNFCTQLLVDLLFTFFTKRFNIHTTIKIMPLLTSLGLVIYALGPTLFPQQAFWGLFAGTVIFSIAAGLCEVLLSPLVAALPSDNPQKDMSTLHSLYAYGVVTVVVISSLFLTLFGRENWMFLVLFWAALPIISCLLYCTSPLPEMDLSHGDGGKSTAKTSVGLTLCVGCIFLGSASENAMTNWISGFTENALTLPKIVGDILGLSLFAVLLGLGRTAYAKYGKNILKILLLGMAGAAVCYLVTGFVTQPVIALIACVITGLCTSMLWPDTLILMEEKLPHVGVAAYALMAAGGDLGGSVAPQLLGAIVDRVQASPWAVSLGSTLSLTPEQVGMKTGMLTAALFPILGVVLLLFMKRYFKKKVK
ncbi:MAG: MFS transporter [Clostridia bacterium]|nr:MFS transporter [Clostridia bacterium]